MKTKTNISKYYKSGEITPPFNSIMLVNQGTTNVNLNGFIIAPGEVFIDSGTEGEINETLYKFSFEGVGVNRLIAFVKKFINV